MEKLQHKLKWILQCHRLSQQTKIHSLTHSHNQTLKYNTDLTFTTRSLYRCAAKQSVTEHHSGKINCISNLGKIQGYS